MMLHVWCDGNVRKKNQKDSRGVARINHIGFKKDSPYVPSNALWRCSVTKQYMTVPEAEMEAALQALKRIRQYLRDHGVVEKVLLHTDSLLVEKWIKSEYRCKANNIKPYLEKIMDVIKNILKSYHVLVEVVKVASEENRAHEVLSCPGGCGLDQE